MINTTDSIESEQSLTFSTDEIYRGQNSEQCLSDDLDTIESNISALQTGKANTNHTHSDYISEDDAVAAFAAINHTHSQYLSSTHTHPDLEAL